MIRRTPEDDAKRFWSKVAKGPDCWTWRASTNEKGYGQFSVRHKNIYAHRFSYSLANGPIPEGLVIDHLCRNRSCVRPEHLEAVSTRENSMRGTHPSFVAHRENRCQRGHEFTPESERWQVSSTGRVSRTCRECTNQRARDRRRKRES